MNLFDLAPKELAGRRFDFRSDLRLPDCRVDIYEPPAEQSNYGLGFDAGYGIPGRDYDAISVFDKERLPYRQVAEVQGYFGPRLAHVVFALARWYNDALVCGERQVGLITLRILYDDFKYRYCWYDFNAISAAKLQSTDLGHHRVKDDVVFGLFRKAVLAKDVLLRSEPLRKQMRRLLFREPAQRDPYDERRPDELLQMKLTGGGSPDLVFGAVYGYCAVSTIGHFPRPQFKYPKGTLGYDLGHNEAFHQPKKANALNPRTHKRRSEMQR